MQPFSPSLQISLIHVYCPQPDFLCKSRKNKASTVVTVRGLVATEENKPAAIKVSFTAKKTGKTSKYTFASKVTVVAPKPAVAELTEVTQKEAAKFAATLSVAVDSVDTKDFSIVRTADNAVIPVKSVALDDAKTGVTIETFMGLTDEKEYAFTYTAKDEAKTASTAKITVTNNKIAKLALTTTNVTAATADDGVKVQTLDANGVLLSTLKFSECAAKYIDVTVTPATAGYRDGDKIYLPEVGNTATVKVVYHTYKYVDGKEEGAIEETFTVTAVADATVMSNFNYTIADAAPAWDSASFKANHTVAIGDAKQAFFYFKNSKNEDKTSSYKVSSSNPSVMQIASVSLTSKSTGVQIQGVTAGTAYIVVKDAKDNLVQTLPVEVVAKRVATSLEVSTQSVTISRSSTAAAVSTVKVYVKDQYGDKMNYAGATVNKIENLSRPDGITATLAESYLGTSIGGTRNTEGTVTVNGSSFTKKGTYTYKYTVTLDGKTVNNTLTVNVIEPGENDTISYDIEIGDSIDMIVDKDNKTPKNFDIKVGQYRGGVLYKYVSVNSIASIEVKNAASEKLDVVSSGATTMAAVVSVNSGASCVVKKAKVGAYTVTVKLQGDKTLTKVFTVKDSQLPVVFKVNKTATGATSTIKTVLSCTAGGSDNFVSYSYDNAELNVSAGDIHLVHGKQLSGEKTLTVTSVDVWVTVPGATPATKVLVNVPVNQMFTSDNAWADGQLVD